MTIAGFTSTGSKRPLALFGVATDGLPLRMERSHGCVVEADGREYLDYIMALGAVALGYGHPDVSRAVVAAVDRGAVGPLSPEDEPALAEELRTAIPHLEQLIFLKTGAEAVAAAVRIARVATGREGVITCGYHGWLDWCGTASGVPHSTMGLATAVPFNDAERTRAAIRAIGRNLACVVVEPVVDAPPNHEWLDVLRDETRNCGAILVFDEIKTAFRVAIGGAAERWGAAPDLMVIGKALANGYPLAAVGGTRDIMRFAADTWISSTLATEFVSISAARATLTAFRELDVPRHLDAIGSRLWKGLCLLAEQHGGLGITVSGIPQMCYLRHADEAMSFRVSAECARRGLLFKRNAYNFVSLAHDDTAVDRALDILDDVLRAC